MDITGEGRALVTELEPGIHILENRPLDTPSPKTEHIRRLLAQTDGDLEAVLRNHDIPPGVVDGDRPAAISAACVHAEVYGTRWSGIVEVPADPALAPIFRYADGPSCVVGYRLARPDVPA